MEQKFEVCSHVFADGSKCGSPESSIIHENNYNAGVKLGPDARDVVHRFLATASLGGDWPSGKHR